MSMILRGAYAALSGKLKIEKNPGYCLKAVRQIIESAVGFPEGKFYDVYVLPYLGEEDYDVKYYWARGAERAMRRAGLATHYARPGDLLFSYAVSKPYGHVGILLNGGLVLENTTADRGYSKKDMGAVRITPLVDFSPVTTVISAQKLEEWGAQL